MKTYNVQLKEGAPLEVAADAVVVENGAVYFYGEASQVGARSVIAVVPLANLISSEATG